MDTSRRLQSLFIKLSPEFLEAAKYTAGIVPLLRPIPCERCIIPDVLIRSVEPGTVGLDIMKRPKWNYEMAKKQVERNEEALFSKWLESTDNVVENWVRAAGSSDETKAEVEEDLDVLEPSSFNHPASPTFFERNLEVWRQL